MNTQRMAAGGASACDGAFLEAEQDPSCKSVPQIAIVSEGGTVPEPAYYLSEEFYERARGMLEKRLTEFRLLHSISVSDTAVKMARRYGTDVAEARIGGLLHDWDKNFTDAELFARADAYGIVLPEPSSEMGSLLHAITGAETLRRTFPGIPEPIIQAVRRHTSGAIDMTDLDIIVYVSDMIEPLRTKGNLKPLRKMVGKTSLEDVFSHAYQMTIEHLVSRKRFIHPVSIEVWNRYVAEPREEFLNGRRDTDGNVIAGASVPAGS